jgi:superfamily II DNA or RNA helicase
LLAHDIGVFVAPPGAGKTVVGARLVAARGRSTLILVHRTQLLDQWRSQLSLFLDLKPNAIGQIGGGKRWVTGSLDVAMIQSLVDREEVDDLVSGYGHVIADECHHVPAVSFERVMREVRARYITGLTATPRRRDGHQPILEFHLGPTRFSIDPRSEAARQAFRHRLIVRETAFRFEGGAAPAGIQEMYARLAADGARNQMILDDVLRALGEGRSPILLTERRDHLEHLAARLQRLTRHLIILRGGMGAKQRREAIRKLAGVPDGEERLVLATGRFLGEGFDDAQLDTLFLAMPFSWRGTLVQYAGRLHREHQGKTDVRIYDYLDVEVPILARMFERRLKGYKAMGYQPEAFEPDIARDERVIEYDEEVLRTLDDDPS